MSSTDASAMGRIARSAAASVSPSSKNARCSASAAASSPTPRASGRGRSRASLMSDRELIDLAIERGQGQAEAIGGGAFVALYALQHGLDVEPLVRSHGIAEIVAGRGVGRELVVDAAGQVLRRDPFPLADDHRVLDRVIELPDVA